MREGEMNDLDWVSMLYLLGRMGYNYEILSKLRK